MDLRLIIFIFFIGFKVIQALTKKGDQQLARKQDRQVQVGRADRKRRVQSEIESFLSEVAGGNAPNAQAQKEAATRKRRDEQKQLAIAKRRQAEERRRRREQAAAKREVSGKQQQPARSSVAQHVEEYMDHDVDEYVEATIVDSVEDHLGSRSAEMPRDTHATERPNSKSAAAVAAMLRNPQGVRNAILVNEILMRPKSLR